MKIKNYLKEFMKSLNTKLKTNIYAEEKTMCNMESEMWSVIYRIMTPHRHPWLSP